MIDKWIGWLQEYAVEIAEALYAIIDFLAGRV